ncbi:Transcription termination/antitermination protein NusG [Clostridium neonatale]|uniref:Transcription termination/antitermination protein NusG n=3 Tax=Clostridium TaxID=1485 RepID=A0A650M1S8_9CLOT|nr:Transcription termination/antitermination protein [Clostridium neonatale]CAG9710573.1 Transcription termination/antitermination protein [Clostridium neonatale]CAG9712443.1 Transcription termination/antitermination protein [Clostridium neonatale]CAH0434943.1 Transcription termination/antitermination protein [Clostridium neonatale]CAI3197862.1 Transcription termination/antitermination protein [Clostridium neonatale]
MAIFIVAEMTMSERARWYVVHTYSGYENKVKANLEKAIENRNLESLIHDIQVPMEEVVEEKDGKRKVSLKKKFPGYVLVKMIMGDEAWYVVRNTRGVTGFVGPGSKPVPLSDDEVQSMGVVETTIDIDLEIGENIRIISGPLRDSIAIIQEIILEKHKVKALVEMFGRETLAELDFNQVEKLV